MKRTVLTLTLVFIAPLCVFSAELSGGNYSIEVSAFTAGGGRVSDSTYTEWGALAQPAAIGKSDSSSIEHLFAGIYTPYIPEPSVCVLLLSLVYLIRRRFHT
jgi:hypothetical protein